jgi:hypothetical protein
MLIFIEYNKILLIYSVNTINVKKISDIIFRVFTHL